jgi:hypothetical protein
MNSRDVSDLGFLEYVDDSCPQRFALEHEHGLPILFLTLRR